MLGELLLAGCGGLVDGTYRGEPLFALTGSVFESDVVVPEGVTPRVGLFWANGATSWEEKATTISTRFPAEYRLEVFAYPPESVRMTATSGDEVRYAVAFPLVYADLDDDGRLGPDEEVIGGSPDEVVVFSEEPVSQPNAYGTIEEMPDGFWRAVTPGNTGEVCSLPITSLTRPDEATPTDLRIGQAWWTALVDWNCDGTFGEWTDICPDGTAAGTWCANADPSEPCADQCTTGPDGNVSTNGTP